MTQAGKEDQPDPMEVEGASSGNDKQLTSAFDKMQLKVNPYAKSIKTGWNILIPKKDHMNGQNKFQFVTERFKTHFTLCQQSEPHGIVCVIPYKADSKAPIIVDVKQFPKPEDWTSPKGWQHLHLHHHQQQTTS